jgi:hypothetical protein
MIAITIMIAIAITAVNIIITIFMIIRAILQALNHITST